MNLSMDQVKAICADISRSFKSYTQLESGAHAHVFRIDTDTAPVTVKVPHSQSGSSLQHEYMQLQQAYPLGPKPIQFDTNKSILDTPYLVMEYLQGETPERFDDRFAQAMANWYNELHSQSCTTQTKGRAQDEPSHIYTSYHETKTVMPASLQSQWDSFFAVLDKKWFTLPVSQEELVLVHADPNHENIFNYDGSVRLVDWEYSRCHCNEWDVAHFLNRYEFDYEVNEKVLRCFLKEYTHELQKLDVVRYSALLSNVVWLVRRLTFLIEGKVSEEHWGYERIIHALRSDLDTAETLLKRV